MRAGAIFLFALALAAQNLAPPPWVKQGGIVNAASHLPVNLPGGALAPGARISIEGLRFDPRESIVEFQAGNRTWPAPVNHASVDRIEARVPDTGFTGPATVFVSVRGKRSAGTPVILGPAAFGIFTTQGRGWGSATERISHPGEHLELRGTGLGHAPPGSVRVLVAGIAASNVRVTRKGGEESVAFTLPPGTPESCAVPVVVGIHGVFGNTATVPVSRGDACDPKANPWAAAPRERRGNVIVMHTSLELELSPGKRTSAAFDSLVASFDQRPAAHQKDTDLIPPPGACIAWSPAADPEALVLPPIVTQTVSGRDLDLGPDIAAQTAELQDLDAGDSISISGPDGLRTAERSQKRPQVYSALLGGNPPFSRIPATPLFLKPGNYTIAIPGGKDVAATDIVITPPGMVEWRNEESVALLDRSVGVDVEWTMPAGFQALIVASNVVRHSSLAGLAVCIPPDGAKRFHVPAYALANLPSSPGGDSDLSLGFLGIAAIPAAPQTFAARGVDRGSASFVSLAGRSVIVK
jgi:uncharacterized protein (TIGR03437 family)